MGTIIQYVLTKLFCDQWAWGMEGICYAIAWNFTSRCAITSIMLKLSALPDVHPQVKFCSKETVRNIGHLFYLCISSCFMTVWLAWALEVLALFSTYLSPEQIAAQTIMRMVNMISCTVPIGFQISCCV